MRRITSLLSEIRREQLSQRGVDNSRIQKCKEYFEYMDTTLSGVTPDEQGGRFEEVMTAADFPLALGEFVQRLVLPSYQVKGFPFEQFVKPDITPNFMPVTRYRKEQGLQRLEWVGEKGEARPGAQPDAVKRTLQTYRWEKQFDFSLEALINDDLGWFQDQAVLMGQVARQTLEEYISRCIWNATNVARLTALGANYFTTGRLTTARISTARMAFNQRVDAAGRPIMARLNFIVHHSGLVDQVATIQRSTLVPELATNAANVVGSTFVAIEDPYLAGVAPNLPWMALTSYSESNITPLVLARQNMFPVAKLIRKSSDQEYISDMLGSGSEAPPIMGDFATGNVVVKVQDVYGTYIDGTEGNMFDSRGFYYSNGTAF